MILFRQRIYKQVLVASLAFIATPSLLQAAGHEAGEVAAGPAQNTAPAYSPYPQRYNYQAPPMRSIPAMPPMRQMPPWQNMPPMRSIPPYQQRPYSQDYRPRYVPPGYRPYSQPYRSPGYTGQPAAPAGKMTEPKTSASSKSISISGMLYKPALIEIKAGESITWTNQDSAPHTVTAQDGISFASTTLSRGAQFTHTFDKPGTYPYYCTYHPNMIGTVVVK